MNSIQRAWKCVSKIKKKKERKKEKMRKDDCIILVLV